MSRGNSKPIPVILVLLTTSLSIIGLYAAGFGQIGPVYATLPVVVGIDCGLGSTQATLDPITTVPIADGTLDPSCSWVGDVDITAGAPDGIIDPLVSDNPSSVPAGTGGGFTVDVRATGLTQNINGFDVSLSYDTRYLDGMLLDQTGLVFGDSANQPFILVKSIDRSTGIIRMAEVLLTGGATGDVTLFRVRFDVVGVGSGNLDIFDDTLTEPQAVPHKTLDGSIESVSFYDPSVSLGWGVSWVFSPSPEVPGSPLTLTATAVCTGCGTLSYSWDTNSNGAADTGEPTGNPATISPPHPIIHRVTLTVSDGSNTVMAVRRLPLTAAVEGPSTIAVNTEGIWTGRWLGGIPTYTGPWRFCPGTATVTTVCHRPAPTVPATQGQTNTQTLNQLTAPLGAYHFAGVYTNTLRITDSTRIAAPQLGPNDVQVTATFLVEVTGTPQAYTITVSNPAKADSGQSVSFTATMRYATTYPTGFRSSSFNLVFDFGDGATSAASASGCSTTEPPATPCTASASHVYTVAAATSFNVKVTAQETAPAAVSKIQEVGTSSIIINPPAAPLVPDFTFDPSNPTAGKPVTLTDVTTGGTQPYTLAWDFGDSSAVGSGSPVSHAYAAKGSYSVSLSVTDSAARTASVTKTVVVTPQPLTVTVACPDAGLTAGKPFTCDVSATGGTSPYSGTGLQSVVFPVKGTYTVSFTVTDANLASASGSDSVIIAPQVLVVTVACPQSGLTAGKPFNCDVSATGGSSPYEGTGSQSAVLAVKGTYTVSFTVTDANAASATGSDTVVIDAQPLMATVVCPDAGLTSGKPFICEASATGGTSPYSGTGSQEAVFPTKGTYAVSFTVTDANGITATGSDTVVIDPQPLVAGFTFSPPAPLTGETVTFTASVSEGTGPYVFSWNFGDGSPAGSGNPATHVYNSQGSFTAILTVTDANGASATDQRAVSVGGALAADFTFTTPATAGKPVTFTAQPSGGAPPYTFLWNFGDGSPTESGSPVSHTYAVKGSYSVTLTVTDETATSASTTKLVAVDSQSLVVDFTFASQVTAGKPVTFTSQVSGGSGPYTVHWDLGNDGSFDFTGDVFATSFPVKGTISLRLHVIDSNDGDAEVTKSITVNPQPLVVTVDCPDTGLTAGKPFTCNVSAAGGTAPYSGTGAFTVSYPVKTPLSVSFEVTDANAVTATGSDIVTIDPQPLIVIVNCPDSGLTVGKPFDCEVSATGGTSPYVGTGTFSRSFDAPGTYTVTFTVTDANEASADGSDTVQVEPQFPGELVVTVNCPGSGLTAGKPFQCDVSAIGGTPPYTGTGTNTVSFPVKGTYTVSFSVTDANGASAQGGTTVVVGPQPLVATAFCGDATGRGTAGKPVDCSASASGGTAPYQFYWFTKADALLGIGPSFTTVFPVKSTYSLVVRVVDVNNARTLVVVLITILPQPLAINAVCQNGTAGKPIVCDASASGGTGPYQFSWDIGKDGLIDGIGPSFTTIFPTKGLYTIDAIVRDANGDTARVNVPVNVGPQPLTVDFTFSPASPPATIPVVFTASASGGTAPYTFSWDFGDETTGAGEQLSHTYSSPGAYTVLLTVTDLNGQTASMTHSVDVGGEPGLTVTIKASPGTSGKPTSFIANIVGGTGPYTVSWDFGDTSSGAGQETSHTYAVKGSYVVTVQVTDSGTLSGSATTAVTVDPQPLIITASCTAATAGKPVDCVAAASGGTAPYTFQWDIGKDGSIDGTGPSFTTTFPVKGTNSIDAIVTDGNEATTRINVSVAVSPQPLSASFVFSPAAPTSGKPVTFTATASGGTLPYSFSWAFGDDSTGDGSEATHTFSVKGSHLVTLTVTDLNRDTATATQQFSVDPQPLAVDFSFGPLLPATGEPVTFMATASGGTAPYLFSWSFGDKTGETGNPAIHAYSSAGTFTVSVTVTDANLASATMSHDVTVSEISQPLTGDFVFGLATSGKPVSFTATASGGVPPYSFTWEFGDGGSAIGDSVTHSYSAKGSYAVMLRVDDSGEESVQAIHTVTVEPQPLIMVAQCLGGTAGKPVNCNVLNLSGGTSPYSFAWDLGGDETIDGTGDSFSTTFPAKGTQLLLVTVTDANAQSASLTFELLIDPQPLVASATIPATATAGNTVSFEVSVTGGTVPYTSDWDFGDGGTGSGTPVFHAYSVKGSYLVSVTVSDANSAVAQTQQLIVIMPQVLEADFAASPSPATVSDLVTFTATVTGGTGPYVFSWDFGDGTTDSGNPAVHTYSSPGEVTAQLTVTDANGATAIAGYALSILPQPVAPVLLTFNGCDVDAFENGVGELSVFINGDFVVNIPAGLHGLTGSGKYAPYDGVCVNFGPFDITSSIHQGINTLVFQNPLSSHFSQIKNIRVVQDDMVLLFDSRVRTNSPGPPEVLTFSVPPLVLTSFQAASAAFVTEPATLMATFTGGTAPFKCTFNFGDGSSKSVTTSQLSCSATHTYWSARLRTATVRVRGVALADDVRGSLLVRVEPQPGCASEDDDNGDEDGCLSWKSGIAEGEQQTFVAQLTNPASVPVLIRFDLTITRPGGSKEMFISPSFALNPGQTLKGLSFYYTPSGGLGTYCFKAPLKYGTDTNNNGVLEDGEILGKRSAVSGCFQVVNAAFLTISPFLFFGTALIPKARSKIGRYFEKKNRSAA
jgi:PKD repeat protein